MHVAASALVHNVPMCMRVPHERCDATRGAVVWETYTCLFVEHILHSCSQTFTSLVSAHMCTKLFGATFVTSPMNGNLLMMQTYTGHMVPCLAACALNHFVVVLFQQSAIAVDTVTGYLLCWAWEGLN